MSPPSGPLPPGVLPDLLHRTAFNLCAALAYSWGGPAWIVSGNPLYTAELTGRLGDGGRKGRRNARPVLVWADPCPEDYPEMTRRLEMLPPGGAVLVLAAGRRRGVTSAGERGLLRLGQVLRWLAARGFEETARYGIGGPEYRFWSRLAYLVERLGQADRADRFRARARAVLLVEGKAASAAILTLVLTVRRSG